MPMALAITTWQCQPDEKQHDNCIMTKERTIAMAGLRLEHGNDNMALTPWHWQLRIGNLAMATTQCQHGNGNMALQT